MISGMTRHVTSPIWDPPPPCKQALNLGLYFPGGRLGRCNLPRETGFCRAAFTRYYYNTSTGNCESFIWGGCGGNANNFNTLDECKKACMRKYIQLISRPATARDPRRGFQLQWKLDSRFHFFGGIKYSSSSIPDSKAQDS